MVGEAPMRVNQRVTVEVTDTEPVERYRSRICAVEADHIKLAAPIQRGAPVPFSVGTSLRVTLFHGGGAHAFTTTVVGRETTPEPILKVSRPAELEALQRRQFFREPAVVKTLCSTKPDDELSVEGYTRNIGGGGVLLRTRNLKALRELLRRRGQQDPLWLEIGLPDHPLRAVANLVWCYFTPEQDHADLAFEFIDLAEAERERLIQYLFVLQREALRKGF